MSTGEAVTETSPPPVPQPTGVDHPVTRRRSRPRALLVAVVLLATCLLASAAGAGWLLFNLLEAREQVEQQRDQIERQNDLLRKKQTFAAAMTELQSIVKPLADLPFNSIVPWDEYQQLARYGWLYRHDAARMDRTIEAARDAIEEMRALTAAAVREAQTNASGTVWESTLDRLGRGYITTRFEDDIGTAEGLGDS